MANSKQGKRRKRKTRGTQAGTIKKSRNARPARGQARSAPAKMTAAQRREQRANTPASWATAAKRGGLTAGLLFVVFVLILKNNIATAALFSLASAGLYTVAFFYVDSFTYQRNQRRKQREREQDGKS